jgi:hypothetical protein
MAALARATATIRLLDLVRTSAAPGDEELERMRRLSPEDLAQLRRETLALQTDLRAELRRREET